MPTRWPPVEYRWRPLFNATVWLTPTTRMPCSNAAKTRKLLKFAGVLQTRQSISAISGRKVIILLGQVEEILLLNKFFSDCQYMPQLRRYGPTKLCDGAQMAIFLRLAFPASRVQHISDMHSKFTLRPHHVSKYGRLQPLRLGEEKKEDRRRRNHRTKI